MEWLASVAVALEASGFGQWAGRSAWAYPVANVVHVFGLILLIGGIGLVDLRILGVFPRLPLQPLSQALTPLAIAGLMLIAASGLVMFAADARAMAASDMFQRKLVLILIALANAAVFRALHRGAGWTDRPPASARIMALASLLLWLLVAVAGRMVAYS